MKFNYKNKLNYFFACIASISFYSFFNYEVLSAVAIGIFTYWLSSLFIRVNYSLPIKELFLTMYALQFLFGPALAYNGLDEYTNETFRMKVNSEEYFSFIIPVYMAFAIGFNVYCKKYSLKISRQNINQWVVQNPKTPYIFIGIGFLASLISSILPSSLAFVFYLLGSFKYIGLFVLLLSFQTLKLKLMLVIYGLILISSFQGGMFHDLLTWIIVLCLILAYRYKPSWQYKVAGILGFVLFAIFIQSIKQGLRAQTWFGNKEASLLLVEDVTADVNKTNSGFLTMDNLGPNFVRINQGWVLASAMDHVPYKIGHTHGELLGKYLYSSIIPRFIDDTKLNAGSQEVFNRYSGHRIEKGTAIGLGLFTDSYVEFGDFGAVFYVFLFGLLYGYVLNQFKQKSSRYPVLIMFVMLVFIYPIRPDCETQTALGHLLKSIMLITIVFSAFKKHFLLK
ncbi:MAG: hypothetical protein ACOVJ8_08685 [Sediminibacterium sp.]